MFKESAFQVWNEKRNLRRDAPMRTLFLWAYWALTLARLTAAASMALLDRVGVDRGDPLVRGEAAKQKGVQAMQQKRHQKQNKPKNEVRSWRGLGS